MLKSILFTHDDLDGCGCRIVYEIAHSYEKKGEDYDVLNCPNARLDEMVLNEVESDRISPGETVIFFADLCARVDTLQVLKSNGYTVHIFDHHETNLPALEIFPDAVVMERNTLGRMVSGTSLLYQYLVELATNHPSWEISKYFVPLPNDLRFERLAKFVETVRSYDTYEWKQTGNTQAKELQTLYFMLGIENFCTKYVSELQKHPESLQLISDSDMMFVKAKMNFEQSVVDSFTLDDVIPIQLMGEVDQIMHDGCMIIANKGAPISEIGYQFLQKHPEFEFMVGVNFNFPGREISFRARDESMQLGQNFAARIGGGGHPKAAGAPMPPAALDDFIDMMMHVLVGGYNIR